MKFFYLISALALLSGLTHIAAAPIELDVNIESRELDELDLFERDLDAFNFDLVAREPGDKIPSPAQSSNKPEISVDPQTGISYSDNPKDWPTEEQMNKLLVPPKDGAWFWSGRVGNINGEDVMLKADEMAKAKGGTTLELLVAKLKFVMPPHGGKTSIWPVAAKAFSRNAQGVVHVLIGEHYRREASTWERIEFKEIKAGKKVTKVVKLQPLSPGKEEVIWPEPKKREVVDY
jgi:hypothetical protein